MSDAGPGRRWVNVLLVATASVVVVVGLVVWLRGGAGVDPVPRAEMADGTTTVPPAQTIAPLTGLPVDGPLRPALMVKIDNVEAARPQSGLGDADVLVETMVEGGLTRYTAVYSSTDPGTVGPIRSVRLTDLQIASLLGRPALVFSGGAEPVLAAVSDAAEAGTVVPVSEDSDPDAFTRSDQRSAPHNLEADADALWRAAPDAAVPAPLFAFGAGAPSNPIDSFEVSFPSVQVAYRWDAAERGWIRSQDQTPMVLSETGAALGVQNVVVLLVDYRAAPHDPSSPVADLDTGGEAWILRDGAMARCRWSTSTTAEPRLDLRAADGTVCALAPGRTIIELADDPPSTGG